MEEPLRMCGKLLFPVEVFKELVRENGESDLFFSPCGLAAALTMLLGGAQGETASQVVHLLRLKKVDPPMAFHHLLIRMRNASPSVRFKFAHVAYLDEKFRVNPKFLSFINKFYEASLREAPFSSDPRSATTTINGRLQQLLKEEILVDPGWVSVHTQLVLVQALQFRGTWNVEFSAENTGPRDFTDIRGKTRPVDMMYADGILRSCVYPDLKVSAVELTYKDVPCSLVLLRPDVSLGLTSLETNLTAEHLERLLKRLEHTGSVAIMMPMLHLRQTIEMSKVLSCLGAKDLFGGGHALGGIASNRPLSASLLVHSVSLKLDERGSLASFDIKDLDVLVASASGPATFTLDRPFMFLLVSWEPFAVLYMGSIREVSPGSTISRPVQAIE